MVIAMEFILMHRPQGPLLPDMYKESLEIGKNIEKMVPGGKLIASLTARAESLIVCFWEAPNVDVFMPVLEKMNMLAWNTTVIPAQKMEDAIPKYEKAIEEAMKKL